MHACKTCNQTSEQVPFYRFIGTYCKVHWAERVRFNRLVKIDQYREYDRARSNREDRVAAREQYADTPAGRAAHTRATNAYRQRNPLKTAAHNAINKAVVRGKLIRQACEQCGTPGAEAHHHDYAQPLAVKWLCSAHHRAEHREGATP